MIPERKVDEADVTAPVMSGLIKQLFVADELDMRAWTMTTKKPDLPVENVREFGFVGITAGVVDVVVDEVLTMLSIRSKSLPDASEPPINESIESARDWIAVAPLRTKSVDVG